ncbi:YkgJ family cysteine cluster protein [Geopsychrobacter electrodiphilus]|uniref:YkgJ family cysteine cluster protein n=1 Tax=Geopsychrobacter electrodiphilus TaxID=225196 RepID=UPI00036E5EEE|nr:YkgJ family cysteine cluster protein [Geopsychrobacter electrodiphilus]
MSSKFNCHCCGNCCLMLVDAYNGCVSNADMKRWQKQGRDDLLAWIETLDLGPGNQLHTAWIHPETGDDVERCPWLLYRINASGYLCGIEATKPDHCRAYPEHQRHASTTGCQGYCAEYVTSAPQERLHDES